MPDYDSPFFITNDRADIDQSAIEDGTAVVWPLSDDAKLVRSPERQYCGNYLTYGDNGAATYRHNADTHDLIAAGPAQHRDMTSSFPMVKTQTKAQARGDRQLLDVQDQDVRITTRLVNIPAERVTLAKAGMRLQIKGTHWAPTCHEWHYARIVTAQPMPHSTGDLFDIDLELVMGMPVETSLSPGPPEPPYIGDVFAGLQRAYNSGSNILAFDGSYNSGHEYAGWPTINETGPVTVDQTASPYETITVSHDMAARIVARAQGAGVYIPAETRTLNITINGGVVATDSQLVANFASWTLYCELSDYDLSAGDVVGVSGTNCTEWGNSGVQETYLAVIRGDYTTTNADFHGPT